MKGNNHNHCHFRSIKTVTFIVLPTHRSTLGDCIVPGATSEAWNS